MTITLNWFTTLLIILGAADLAIIPAVFDLWWNSRH